jgi:hypothetical protein
MMRRFAMFDATGAYRYRLDREWDDELDHVLFIMLNPSIANAEHDDPTVRRCMSFARFWGYGALSVVNLFAYRSPSPDALRRVTDPVGPDNDAHLSLCLSHTDLTVVAWGNWGALRERDRSFLAMLTSPAHCLGMTGSGQPRHPLYVSGAQPHVPFRPPARSRLGLAS